MKAKILLLAAATFLTIQGFAQTVTDIDGNVYNTVTIGTQTWLKENLNVQHYNNGDPIPQVTDKATWANLSNGAYCYYYNDSITYANLYGKLYNFYAIADSRKVCPTGWSIPTQAEWETLQTYLGGENVAGGKMKEIGTTHWLSPNTGATNSSGFTGLPGGFRRSSGSFGWVDSTANWWSLTPVTCYIWMDRLWYNSTAVEYYGQAMESGYSVRCFKNNSSSFENIQFPEKIIIFPNPASNLINIYSAEKQNLKIFIHNTIGDMVLKGDLNNSRNEMDISALPTGIYIITVSGRDWTVRKKIIKE
jgi:uncharacterized protein (TIGR02145 family)